MTGHGGHAPTALAWQLRRALAAHRLAIAVALRRAGCDDLPPRALWAIDALRDGDRSAAELARLLGVSRQAMSPLVELLVRTGYVARGRDAHDRRRISLRLTARGRVASTAIARACAHVESRAGELVGARELERTRATLDALGEAAGRRRTAA
jgi:DNA-binding MarR family transcriptional regulator